jgi:hypothetical protein
MAGKPGTAFGDRWQEFWFAKVPPHTYAVFRVAVGLAGIATILGAWDLAFWRVDGIAPIPGGGLGIRPWILENGYSVPMAWVIRTMLLAGYVCLALGIQSMVMAVTMFVGSSAMLWWNWYPFSGAQHMLHNLTLYLVCVDSGRVWSWDAWAARRRGTPLAPDAQPIWPLRLVRCQMAVMYFAAGCWKLDNPDWRAGDALHYVLNSNVFQRMPGSVPPALYPLTVLLTYLTVVWELLFPAMLWWRPARVSAIAVGVLLHLGMWSTIEIGAFSLTVFAGYTAFLDPARTEDRMRRLTAFLSRAS